MIKTLLGFVGLGGAVIPTGYLVAGAVAACLAILGGTWTAGYNYRGTLDRSAALELENTRLRDAAAETARQLGAVNAIQQRDADRAVAAEGKARELQQQIDDTPVNNGACLDAATAGRVFGNGQRAPVGGPKHSRRPR